MPPGALTGVKGTADLAARTLGIVTSRWRRWRSRRQAERRIKLLITTIQVRVPEPDTATFRIDFRIVNFTGEKVTVDHVEVDASQIVNRSLPEQAGFLKATGEAASQEVGYGSFSMRFHADGVRAIISAVAPAPNKWSSPSSADVKVVGVCVLQHRGKNLRILFEFYTRTPDIRLPERAEE